MKGKGFVEATWHDGEGQPSLIPSSLPRECELQGRLLPSFERKLSLKSLPNQRNLSHLMEEEVAHDLVLLQK